MRGAATVIATIASAVEASASTVETTSTAVKSSTAVPATLGEDGCRHSKYQRQDN
jgi:hypothetical protein